MRATRRGEIDGHAQEALRAKAFRGIGGQFCAAFTKLWGRIHYWIGLTLLLPEAEEPVGSRLKRRQLVAEAGQIQYRTIGHVHPLGDLSRCRLGLETMHHPPQPPTWRHRPKMRLKSNSCWEHWSQSRLRPNPPRCKSGQPHVAL